MKVLARHVEDPRLKPKDRATIYSALCYVYVARTLLLVDARQYDFIPADHYERWAKYFWRLSTDEKRATFT